MRRHLALPRHHLVALFFFTALTIAFTYPLLPNLTTHVIGGAKLDNYEYVWKMWWVPHAIFDLGISPWFHPDIYHPFGYPLAYGEITPIHTFGMMPITRLFGEIVSYNLAMLGSTLLTGWATYLVARRWLARLTDDPKLVFIASVYAGAAFAFSASRLLKLTGHLPLVNTHWLVLALFFFDQWLENRRLREAGLTGLMISFAMLSSWYYGLLLGLLLPVYALARCGLRSLVPDKRSYLAAGVVVVIVGVLCLPFLLPYLQLDTEGATVVPLEDAAFWAASPTDYLMPNALHPVWGTFVQRVMWPFPTPMITEFVIPIGWITLLLGLWALRNTGGGHWRALKWAMLVAFILSLGPYLYLSRLPLGVPLPVLFLRDWLPIGDSIRTWGRFSTFVMLGFSILAGAGLLLALEAQRWRYEIAGGALLLMLFGAWTGPMSLSPVEPRPVDLWLAEQEDDAPIMEYPLSAALSGPAMYYTRYHGKPVVFGYGTYLPLLYRQRHPDLLTFPQDPALDQLEAWGVRYILVTTDILEFEPFNLADLDVQPRLRPVDRFENVAVYEITGAAE